MCNKKQNDECCNYEQSIPDDLQSFIDAYETKNGKNCSNHGLYTLKTVDINGNITGEAYGINLLTDVGFSNMFYTGLANYYFPNRIAIGTGTTPPSVSDTRLENQIMGKKPVSVYNGITQYPVKFDADTNIISQTYYQHQCYYDYNIDNVDEDIDITEIGYMIPYSSSNVLSTSDKVATRALVYDEDGNVSSITKHVNERLYISYYYTICMKPDWIDDLYEKGVCCASAIIPFSPNRYFIHQSDLGGEHNQYSEVMSYYYTGDILMTEATTSSYKLATPTFRMKYTTNAVSFEDSVITAEHTIGEQLISDKKETLVAIIGKAGSGMYDTNKRSVGTNDSTLYVLTKPKLATPETIVSDKVYLDFYHQDEKNMRHVFRDLYASEGASLYTAKWPRADGSIPVSDFNMQSSYMYNYETNEWDIEETFVNAPDADYSACITGWCTMYMYVTFLNRAVWVHVALNTNTEIPITYLEGEPRLVYATDTYWDTSTYIPVNVLDTFDMAAAHKRYFVTVGEMKTSFYYIILAHRGEMPIHRLTTTTTPVVHYYYIDDDRQSVSATNNVGIIITNEEYGYCFTGTNVIYPNTNNPATNHPYIQKVLDIKNDDDHVLNMPCRRCGFNTPGRIFMLSTAYASSVDYFHVIDISDDHTVAPTYTTYNTVTDSFVYQDKLVLSSSKNGFVVISKGDKNCTTGYSEEPHIQSDEMGILIYDMFGGDDGKTVTKTHIANGCRGNCVENTDYCVYKNDDADTVTFVVYNMKTNTIFKTFTLPNLGTISIDGITAWNNYIYILHTVNNSEKMTFLYEIAEERLTRLPVYYSTMCGTSLMSKSCVTTEAFGDIMVCCNHKGVPVFIRDSDPYTINPLFTDDMVNKTSDNYHWGMYSPTIYLFDHNRGCNICMTDTHLLCMIYIDGKESYIFDLGDIINNGPHDHMYLSTNGLSFIKTNSLSTGYSFGIFDNMLVCADEHSISGIDDDDIDHPELVDGQSYYQEFNMYPIEYFVPHKVTGTTKTITAYNNPKKIGTKTFKFKVSNDTSKWVDDSST